MKFVGEGLFNKSLLTFFLVACLSFAVLNMGVVSAKHDAIVTIDPNIANCEQLGNTFTVNIENDISVPDADDIFEVRIYSGTYGIVDFSCGPAPTGWTLWDFTSQYGYCEYKTAWDGIYVIEPGEDLDFTFDATMQYTQECYSAFLVSTLDNKRPEGEHEYNWPQVFIDCTPPEIDKSLKYGTGIGVCPPSVQGPSDECWIRQSTCVEFDGHDLVEDDPCNLGLTYCEYTYTVDGSPHTGPIRVYPDKNGHAIAEICFGEDSLHILNITCYDVAGNVKEDIERFRVDDTPPVTTKVVSEPKKIVPIPGSPYFIEWVDSVTKITLSAVDPDPTTYGCNIGVDKIWYKNIIACGEDPCWDPMYCTADGVPTPYDQEIEPGCIDFFQFVCEDDNYWMNDFPSWEACVEFFAHTECQVDPEWHLYDGTPIQKPDESCHILYYFAVDYLGNIEDMKVNCFFVDHTPPKMIKEVGIPNVPCRDGECKEFDYWVRDPTNGLPGTEITLDCDDTWDGEALHPSGDEEVCYRVSYDLEPYDLTDQYCDEPLELITQPGHEGEWCCVTPPEIIIFVEDSLHDLEYFCRDAVDKKSEIDLEWFRVDSLPPIIEKTMLGDDHLGQCPPVDLYDNYDDYVEDCYVRDDGLNGVKITVYDDETFGCAVDDVVCYKWLYWEATREECEGAGGDWLTSVDTQSAQFIETSISNNGGICLLLYDEFSEYQEIYFTEDSTHYLEILCFDALENVNYDFEIFLVDSTPPETTKEYGKPYKYVFYPPCLEACEKGCEGEPECIEECTKGCQLIEWISSETPIYFYWYDEKVGVEEVWYKNVIVPDGACWEPFECWIAFGETPDGEWKLYWKDGDPEPDPIYKPEESCHLIKYYSIDKLGNEEEINYQCVFVDNTPPVSVKDHEGPFIEDDGFDWVTRDTLIYLDCEDQGDHPVDQETLCFKVSLDDEGLVYLTANYCPYPLNDEGYCCVYVGDDEGPNYLELYFMEDSYHNLEYYCVDHLGNDERDYNLMYEDPEDITEDGAWIQWYKVDTEPPVTTKTYIPDSYVDPTTGYEYIDTAHEIELTAIDGGQYCAIGVEEIQYRVSGGLADNFCENCENWMSMLRPDMGPWKTYTGRFGIDEESCHVIEYRSIDYLGNTEDINWQCVFVDKKKPITTKWYEPPCYPMDQIGFCQHGYPKWITSHTEVWFSAEDPEPHPSGVAGTYYKDTYLPDEEDWYYCYEGCEDWAEDDRSAQWGKPTAPEPYNPPSPAAGWLPWTGEPFFKEPESCHIIEYYSYDNVGKVEDIRWQCVFVDDTAPEPNKTVGEPKAPWEPTNYGVNCSIGEECTFFYPEIIDKCWSEDPEEMIECWKVTMMTPIYLDCVDPEPHPVDHETVCFNVELDGTDDTERYCEWYGGDMEDNGFCCLDHAIEEFYFLEETEHNLKYYCVDALGNSNEGDVDEEKFKVGGTVFEIPLYKKWNLISVPFVLLDNAPEEVFKDTPGVEAVWAYDGETDQWYVWGPGPMTNNLNSIDPGWGYWVLEMEDPEDNCIDSCVEGDVSCLGKCGVSEWLIIGGELFSTIELPAGRNLVKGWNLIGYYGTSWELYPFGDQDFVCGDAFAFPDRYIYGDNAYCSLNTLVNKQEGYPRWSSLWSYIRCPILDEIPIPHIDLDGVWVGINTCADPESPMQMALSRMYAGRGYWIHMGDDKETYSYAPSSTCIWNDDFKCVWTGGGILP